MPAFSSADPNAYVALAMQTALGSPQTAVAKFRYAKYSSGNSFTDNIQVQDLREGGDGLDFGTTYKQRQVVEGNLAFNARPEFLPQLLQIAIGGATWDGGSAPAIHTFHTNHASMPYGTIAVAHPGTDLLHFLSDVRFTGISFQLRAGMPIAVRAPFKAITFGASHGVALAVATTESDGLWVMHMSPSYVLDGTGDSTIEEVNIDVAYGTEDLQAQSVFLDDVPVFNRDVNVSVVRRYQNSTLWKKIHYNGGVSPTSGVATGSLSVRNTYGTGAGVRLFQADLGLLSYRDNALTELNPDGQTVKETIRGKALKTASANLTLKVHNVHASAYAP